MANTHRPQLLALGLSLVLVASACGSSDSDSASDAADTTGALASAATFAA